MNYKIGDLIIILIPESLGRYNRGDVGRIIDYLDSSCYYYYVKFKYDLNKYSENTSVWWTYKEHMKNICMYSENETKVYQALIKNNISLLSQELKQDLFKIGFYNYDD